MEIPVHWHKGQPYITLRCRTCNMEFSVEPEDATQYCSASCQRHPQEGGKGYRDFTQALRIDIDDIIKSYEDIVGKAPINLIDYKQFMM